MGSGWPFDSSVVPRRTRPGILISGSPAAGRVCGWRLGGATRSEPGPALCRAGGLFPAVEAAPCTAPARICTSSQPVPGPRRLAARRSGGRWRKLRRAPVCCRCIQVPASQRHAGTHSVHYVSLSISLSQSLALTRDSPSESLSLTLSLAGVFLQVVTESCCLRSILSPWSAPCLLDLCLFARA